MNVGRSVTVFLSYSRDKQGESDQIVAQKLDVLLRPLADIGHKVFYDTRWLEAGAHLDPSIDRALAVTDVGVLLVSPDYLDSSRYPRRRELPVLLDRHRIGVCTLVPVMVRRAPGLRVVDGLNGLLFANDTDQPLLRPDGHLDDELGRIAELIFDRVLELGDSDPPPPGGGPEPSGDRPHSPDVASGGSASSDERRAVERLAPADRLGGLLGVPALPVEFFDRPAELAAIREALASGAVTGIVGRGAQRTLGVAGQGGIGKTMMALAAAHDPGVRALFPDGVVWLTVGEQRPALEAQVALLRLLGDNGNVRTTSDARQRLDQILANGRRLVILDDVWTRQQVDQLTVTSGQSRTLVTTRHPSLVLEPTGAAVHQLGLLQGDEAARFLADATGPQFAGLDVDVPGIVATTGGVALALALVGGALRHGVDPVTVLAKLQTDTFGDHPYANAFRALNLAAGALDNDHRHFYLSLAVFPADRDIPISVIRPFWRHLSGMEDSAVDQALGDLVGRSLLVVDGPVARFHDLQHDYVRYANDRRSASLHGDLLDAVKPVSGRWHDLPTDQPYLWDELVNHIHAAGLPAAPIVNHPAWWIRRITTSGIAALERDLAAAGAEDSAAGTRSIQVAEKLSRVAHLIPSELPHEIAAACRLWLVRSNRVEDGTGWQGLLPALWGELKAGTVDYGQGAIRTITGHTGGVLSVAWSPDGTHLATAGWDRTVRVWDAATGTQTHLLDGHTGGVVSVAWSPDGTHLASASTDRSVRVWDAATSTQTHQLDGHTNRVVSVAWSPDGTHLATASWDHSARVWDAATGTQTHQLDGHTNEVESVAWSPDGTHLASAGWDHSVRVWDAATGTQTHKLDGHTKDVVSVAWSPDGTHLATAGWDRTVRVWDAATSTQTHQLDSDTKDVVSVAWSPDGTHLATASWDERAQVWDAATGTQTHLLYGHTNEVVSVAWSPDGTHLATASWDGSVRVWDTATQTHQLEGHPDRVVSVAWSPDGTHLATASWDRSARVWDAATGTQTHLLRGHTNEVVSVAWSPDGTHLATASNDRTVRVWDAATGTQTRQLEGHNDRVGSVAWSPDGTRLASASWDRSVRVWDAATGIQTHQIYGHTDRVVSVAWSPDGTRLAFASWDRTVRVCDAATGTQIHQLHGHTDPVGSVAWSPDGTHLATASWDRSVRVWDAATGIQTHQLDGHTNEVVSVAWSPDGTHLATASNDRSVRVWDAAGLVVRWRVGLAVRSVAYSPDGERLSVGVDNDWLILRLNEY